MVDWVSRSFRRFTTSQEVESDLFWALKPAKTSVIIKAAGAPLPDTSPMAKPRLLLLIFIKSYKSPLTILLGIFSAVTRSFLRFGSCFTRSPFCTVAAFINSCSKACFASRISNWRALWIDMAARLANILSISISFSLKKSSMLLSRQITPSTFPSNSRGIVIWDFFKRIRYT